MFFSETSSRSWHRKKGEVQKKRNKTDNMYNEILFISSQFQFGHQSLRRMHAVKYKILWERHRGRERESHAVVRLNVRRTRERKDGITLPLFYLVHVRFIFWTFLINRMQSFVSIRLSTSICLSIDLSLPYNYTISLSKSNRSITKALKLFQLNSEPLGQCNTRFRVPHACHHGARKAKRKERTKENLLLTYIMSVSVISRLLLFLKTPFSPIACRLSSVRFTFVLEKTLGV